MAADLGKMRDEPEAKEAISVPKSEFLDADRQGPMKAAVFLTGGPDDDIQADAAGYIHVLIELVEE